MIQELLPFQPQWLILAGHYPIYSYGSHGDTDELIQYLYPLVEKYSIDIVFAGHDHISQHVRFCNYNSDILLLLILIIGKIIQSTLWLELER